MSSEHADADADAPAVPEDDADLPELAQVAPDDFLDRWGASSYEEAIDKAEGAPTSTPAEKIKRCPYADCLSQRIRRKPGYDDQHKIDAEYRCTYCSRHFDDPIVGEPDSADELVVVDTDGEETEEEEEEPDDDTDEDTDPDTDGDPFVWVSEENLAEPPLDRRLAALDDDVLAALAIYCYRPWGHTEADPSYRELGRIFPYSRTWVGDRVREWKSGEYRDLVPDPRPRVDLSAAAGEVSAE